MEGTIVLHLVIRGMWYCPFNFQGRKADNFLSILFHSLYEVFSLIYEVAAKKVYCVGTNLPGFLTHGLEFKGIFYSPHADPEPRAESHAVFGY